MSGYLINVIEEMHVSIYGGGGIDGPALRWIAEQAPKVAELMLEVAALATKADELEDDDDQDPAFAAAEAAMDAFWDAMAIVGFRKDDGTPDVEPGSPPTT